MKLNQVMTVVAALSITASAAFATTVGYVTKTVAPGGLTAINNTFQSPADATVVGTASGSVTAVSSGQLVDSNATFATDFTASGTIPFYVRITGDEASGRIYRITGNANPTTLSITPQSAAPDLSTVITAATTADTYEILRGSTISESFSLAGPENGDTVFVINGAGNFITLQYDGSQWLGQDFGLNFTVPSDGFVIEPWGGVIYQRSAGASSSITLTTSGTVGDTDAVVQIPGTGLAFLSLFFPTDIELSQTNIQSIANLVTGTTTAADQIIVFNGVFTPFVYDGSNWLGQDFSLNFSVPSDSFLIPAGTPIFIQRGTGGTPSAEPVTITSPL